MNTLLASTKQFWKRHILPLLKNLAIQGWLPPWVFIWLYLIVLTVITFFVQNFTPEDFIPQNLEGLVNQNLGLARLWQQMLLFILLNYVLAVSLRRHYPRLRFFFVTISLLVLVVFSIILWPYLQESLQTA
jgi:hypothetical protein